MKLIKGIILGMAFGVALAVIADSGLRGNFLRLIPGTLPTGGVNGELRVDSSDNSLRKFNATSSTWQLIAGSTGTGINHIGNGDFETDAVGWVAYADAAGTDPVDGTGGSPTVTIVRITSTPLRGDGTGQITKDAADRQGEGVSFDFTVDRQDSVDGPQPQIVSFRYRASTNFDFGDGTAADPSDVSVWIFDVTNGVLIQPAPFVLDGSGQFAGEFQPNADSDSYRLILHIPVSTALTWTFDYDTVVVGPSNLVRGPPVTDWVTWTPTGTWGNTTFTGFFRRIGDSIETQIRIVNTGAPSGNLEVDFIPTQFLWDTAKYNRANSGEADILCTGMVQDTGTAQYIAEAVATSGQSTRVRVHTRVAGRVSATNPFTFANTDEIILQCHNIPIIGFSSNMQLSDDASTRIISSRASGDPASATVGNPVIFPTSDFDTHGVYSVSTGLYTAPVTGKYRVHGFIISANAAITLNIAVDGTTDIAGGITDASGEGTYTGIVDINAGQTISLEPSGTLDAATGSTFMIERLSGPATIAASEKVVANYRDASGQSIPNSSTTVLDFDTKIIDTHAAVSGSGTAWIFTAPVTGLYAVFAVSTFESGVMTNDVGSINMVLQINAVNAAQQETTINLVSARIGSPITEIVDLNAGDTVAVAMFHNNGAARTRSPTAVRNRILIWKIGGI